MEGLKFMNTTKTVSIVFYKGSGNFRDKLIRLWTKSPYSHSEFGRSDGLYHSNDRFRLVSRAEMIDVDSNDWEICKLILPSEVIERVEKRQLKKNGTSYDWIGIIFSQVFRLGIHDSRRWFCSKSNADDLHYAYKLMQRAKKSTYEPYVRALHPIQKFKSNELSPSDLFAIVREIEQLQNNSHSNEVRYPNAYARSYRAG
jgi:hypothetical protein